MTGGMAAFMVAVGGTSLICYLLMNRVQSRRPGAGPAATRPASAGSDSSGGDGWSLSSWFGSDNSSSDSSSSSSDSGGGTAVGRRWRRRRRRRLTPKTPLMSATPA